jgi:hypothetical protein
MSNTRYVFSLLALASLAGAVGLSAGCGASGNGAGDGGLVSAGSNGQGFGLGDDGTDASVNLPRCIVATNQCVASCPNNGKTTVSGQVFDPAGKNPLYGITVYIPSTPPGPLPEGAGCYTCSSLYQAGNGIAFAVTDSDGKFTLDGVPDGSNIPLIVQVGKWRMQYVLPQVDKCTDNAASMASSKIAAPAVLRLPKNRTEGDIPKIAIATGGADSLECLLSRIGVDKAEYGAGAGGAGRIHIYQGTNRGATNGANTQPAAPNATTLWDTKADLMQFDLTLLTCEGAETEGMNQQALYDYTQAGGRVFASHFHYAWFNKGPFAAQNLAQWTPTAEQYGTDPNAIIETTLPSGAAFPRGEAMKEWMMNVNALTNGEFHIVQARHNAVVTAANAVSTPWITTDTSAKPPSQTEYFSFDTPFGTAAAEQCGRVVYSDLHVGAASGDYGGKPDEQNIPANAIVPSGCAVNDLSSQEKALEFMLFDLSGCITPPDQGAGGVPVNTK